MKCFLKSDIKDAFRYTGSFAGWPVWARDMYEGGHLYKNHGVLYTDRDVVEVGDYIISDGSCCTQKIFIELYERIDT